MFGAIIGDMVGAKYEFNNIKTKNFPIETIGDFSYTDDSIMTLAVGEVVQNALWDYEDEIIDIVKSWGKAFPNAGYGGRFFNWVLGNDREPYGSYGNGSAMRVSACGWYAKSEEEVKMMSKAVTQITHNHKEGLKGAKVTAMCVYYAKIGKDKEFIRKYAEKEYPIIKKLKYEDLIATYSHEEEICQNTVPQAIYCFLISKDFEDCLRTTISIGGDCDTTAAISCAIAEAYYKYIPRKICRLAYQALPEDVGNCSAKEIISGFLEDKTSIQSSCEEIDNQTKFILMESFGADHTTYEWAFSKRAGALVDYVKDIVLEDISASDDKKKELTGAMYKLLKKGEDAFGDAMINFIGGVNGLLNSQGINRELVFFDKVEDALDFLKGKVAIDSEDYSKIFKNYYKIKK